MALGGIRRLSGRRARAYGVRGVRPSERADQFCAHRRGFGGSPTGYGARGSSRKRGNRDRPELLGRRHARERLCFWRLAGTREDRRRTASRSAFIDQVSLVSGVSGGSITAAYFALHGRETLANFRQRFLVQDAEASLSTSVNVTNLVLLAKGGVNDRTGLPTWLDENLFHGATFDDVLRPGHPQLWINASDIFNRTTFIFNTVNFGALCSDLRRYPLSEAVAASAAVPLVFAPIVIENYADRCTFTRPTGFTPQTAGRARDPARFGGGDPALPREVRREVREAARRRHDRQSGLSGFVLELAAATKPYQPLTPRQAVNLKRFLFVVVDAGRPPGGDLAKNADSPELMDLIQAVSDTAVDANVRAAYDAFLSEMEKWRERLIDYRCGLTPPEVVAVRGSMDGWDCRGLSLQVAKVSFEAMREPSVRSRLRRSRRGSSCRRTMSTS